MGVRIVRNLKLDADILPWFKCREWSPVLRHKIEGSNHIAFLHLPSNSKTFEIRPTALLSFGLVIHICFDSDKSISDDTIGFGPSLKNLWRSRISKYLLN